MTKPAIIIFDFDGTICDSFLIFTEILAELSSRYGFKKVSPDEVEDLRLLSMQEILDHLAVPRLKIPFIVRSARKAMQMRFAELKAFPQIAQTIRILADQGNICGCLTSNSGKLVADFFERERIPMEFISAGSSLFGKAPLLRKAAKRERTNYKKTLQAVSASQIFSGIEASHPEPSVYYIGDEIRDIVAAKEAGVGSIAVTWGYNHHTALAKENPDHLIDNPGQLIKFF